MESLSTPTVQPNTQEVARQAKSEVETCLLAKGREHQVTVGAGYRQSRSTASGSVENENLSEGFTACLQIMKTLNVRWMHAIQTEQCRMSVTAFFLHFFFFLHFLFFACSETCYRSIKGSREGLLNVLISRWCFIGTTHSICGPPPKLFFHLKAIYSMSYRAHKALVTGSRHLFT